MTNRSLEKRIKHILYALIFGTFLLSIGQNYILNYKFNKVDAELVEIKEISDTCDHKSCVGKFELKPSGKYLLIGNILRNYELNDERGAKILPTSIMRGLFKESWRYLQVYQVDAGSTYLMTATKPSIAKIDYFMGVLPRSSNKVEMVEIPGVLPNLEWIISNLSIAILWLLLVPAFFVPGNPQNREKRKSELEGYLILACSITFLFILFKGMADSLMSSGDTRAFLVRQSILSTMTLIVLTNFYRPKSYLKTKLVLLATVVPFAVLYIFWDYLRAGAIYTSAYATLVLMLSVTLLQKRRFATALVPLIALHDCVFMLGMSPFKDIPPTYLMLPAVIATYSVIYMDLGSVKILSLAAKLYQGFTRDIGIAQLSNNFSDVSKNSAEQLSHAASSLLPDISKLTGATRVSILLNFSFSRPIFHSFNNGKTTTYDDGKVPGEVTLRSFLYGDEAWFKTYNSFCERTTLGQNIDGNKAKNKLDHDYVCISPIRVNDTITGVLMLTGFDDNRIESLIKTGDIQDEKDNIRSVLNTIEKSFSKVVIANHEDASGKSSELRSLVRQAISLARDESEFLTKYCEAVSKTTGLWSIIHQRVGNEAEARAFSGIPLKVANKFFSSSLMIDLNSDTNAEPTIDAFSKNAPSILLDWKDQEDIFGLPSKDIHTELSTLSIMATPLAQGENTFVLTLMSDHQRGVIDPGILGVIESSEVVFDAALTVFSQKSSVHALGELANRLIGDDEIRYEVVEAAKSKNLPSIVGSTRESFLFLIDLVGSSQFEGGSFEKAQAFGSFYNIMDEYANKLTHGKVRKTIGDAIIITWDGSLTSLLEQPDALKSLQRLVAVADEVAKSVGCKGVRSVLHYGDYFFGLVGTTTFGQIDVIGSGIDYVCKLEGAIKSIDSKNSERVMISVSHEATEVLIKNGIQNLEHSSFLNTSSADIPMTLSENITSKISYICMDNDLKDIEVEDYTANRAAS